VRLKGEVRRLLGQPDFSAALVSLRRIPARRIVSPLFACFYSGEETVRWRAITAVGIVVAELAESDRESARVVMRRLMWTLNDESGGIGWGSPEAMGDIMARSRKMAEEYANILVSYIREDGNYLEHEGLQRGALWGVGRLAGAHPDLAAGARGHLGPFLDSRDPWLRGLAAWTACAVGDGSVQERLSRLTADRSPFTLFCDGELSETTVGAVAGAALASGRMDPRGASI
jgi:hypothetical protein